MSQIRGIEAVIDGVVGWLAHDREAARKAIAATEANSRKQKDILKHRLQKLFDDYQNDWLSANQTASHHV